MPRDGVFQTGKRLVKSLSWNALVERLFQPTDSSSLAVSRILFGLLMFLDIPEERKLAHIDVKWSDENECRFPLFNALKPLNFEWMCVVYLIMWLGSLGMTLGAFYRLSCLLFAIPYWYIFLLDKTAWNNHSYLYGLVSLIFFACDAHFKWSVDANLRRVTSDASVPFWNYVILRFQQFVLYFYAGLKKIDFDWLTGQSQAGLSNHFMFSPFRYFLSNENIDLWIIHVGGYLLDITAGFSFLFDRTRPVAFFFMTIFHTINSQVFKIGMFPYVCLSLMPLFCVPDWPKRLTEWRWKGKISTNLNCNAKKSNKNKTDISSNRKHLVVSLLAIYAATQLALPYSHFITKGFNNWTKGLYGYSWDMMVHTWDTSHVAVKVINKDNGEEIYLSPTAWVKTDKWQRHADMAVQYAQCLKNRILSLGTDFKNFSIHFDVMVSLNHRFKQRMFDPNVDLLSVEWSPFHSVPWVMPLLNEFTDRRSQIKAIEREVFSRSNDSNLIFIADFPGYRVDNFIGRDVTDVSLTVVEGRVGVEIAGKPRAILEAGSTLTIPSDAFHAVRTLSDSPSGFFYVFSASETKRTDSTKNRSSFCELGKMKLKNFIKSWSHIKDSLLKIGGKIVKN